MPDKVLERRLRILKELGANAIRTSHMAILQSAREPGKVRLTARANGLGETTVEIEAKP